MRERLGSNASFASRETVYQTDDAFEVETRNQFEIVRRRVLFEDVLMVTLHHAQSTLYLIFTILFGLFFLGLGLAIASLARDTWPAAIPFFVIGAPALIAFFYRLVYGLDVITIFGRRSKASVRFSGRGRRAREVYGQICAAVRSAQRQAPQMPSDPTQQTGIPLPSES